MYMMKRCSLTLTIYFVRFARLNISWLFFEILFQKITSLKNNTLK